MTAIQKDTAKKSNQSALDAINAVQGLNDVDDLDNVDDLLAQLDAEDAAAAPDDKSIEDDAISALHMADIKHEAYESQDASDLNLESEPVVVEKVNLKAATGEKKRAVKRTSTASMTKSAAIIHKLGESRYESCVLCETDAKLSDSERKKIVDDFIISVDEIPKKVGEKVLNLLCHLNSPSAVALSVYTLEAINLLKTEGTFTTAQLRNHYLDKGYAPGTAGAQASQIMTLLPFMMVAKRDNRELTTREDSIILLCI